MNNKICSLAAAALFSGAAFLGLSSCRENTILDASIIPAGDTVTVGSTDTITILTKTYFDDSLNTSEEFSGIPIYHALGAVTSDPYFGKTHAGIYFQIVPGSLGFKFPETPDSAFLILPYSGFSWGDTNSLIPQTFTAYELTDTLHKDSAYFNYSYTNVDRSAALGNAQVTYRQLKDSMMIGNTKVAGMLRIRLSQAFINKIKTEADKTENSALKTYPEFLRFFKGIYVEADSNSGSALHYFRLDGNSEYTRANVLFYYTDDSVKTASFYYSSTYAAHYNRIRRNITGSQLQAIVSSTAQSDSIMVIQAEPGAVAELTFPYIKYLPKQPINKAELIITEYSFFGDMKETYFPPSRIFPIGVNNKGGVYTIKDRLPVSSSAPLLFMDGNRRTVTLATGLTVHQYVLNIPREVQTAIVEGRDELKLRISAPSTYPGAYRLIAAGGKSFSNSAMRVKLNIVYSKL